MFLLSQKATKISRHLVQKHKNEDEVKKFLHFPKGSYQRRDLIGQLRKKGNFSYNTKESLNDGWLVVSRRPNKKYIKAAEDFKACPNCLGFFSKNSLRVHFRKCNQTAVNKERHLLKLSKQVSNWQSTCESF